VSLAAVLVAALLAGPAHLPQSIGGAIRVPPPIDSAAYAARRAALAATITDGVILALGAPEPDADYESFDQAPSFAWLTGILEPDAALVLVKHGGGVTGMLFVQPADPEAEVWTGHRIGPAGATASTGLPSREFAQLPAVLDSLLASARTLYVVGIDPTATGAVVSRDAQLVRSYVARHPHVALVDLTPTVRRLRGSKSAAELSLIRKAIAITVDAQATAFATVAPDVNEFEVQAAIEYTFRRLGADRPSFASIIGSGPNGTTLHYNADDRFMRAGELVVMDVGASYRGYAADVTRTVPVSGKFTAEQRALYQIVRDAQAAAERQATPGALARRMSDSATAVLAAGLTRLGLIESDTASYDCGPDRRCQQYTLYYMHGLGHGIGLEVHDPEQFYYSGKVEPGSVFTIEPGLYVRRALPSILPDTPRNRATLARIGPAIARYADTGVRIEDDYIETSTGVEWVSRAPREIADVEAALRAPRAPLSPRDTVMIDWYRTTAPR
jgi:Xaa-Pro aminopeptidase